MKKEVLKVFPVAAILIALILFGCNSSILDDPSISINYRVPEKSIVKLTIENSYNTTILTPVNKEQDAGYYQINVDANNLPEGVYFYTIELRGVNSTFYLKTTKNLLLVK